MLASLLCLVGFCLLSRFSKASLCNKQTTTHVNALLGNKTQLPCNVSEASPNDKLQLIFWYRETSNSPFYSIDARNTSFVYANHLLVDVYKGRMYFSQTSSLKNGFLFIRRADLGDKGNYCCRVDFLNSPTRYYAINLDVIILPLPPVITNERDEELGSLSVSYNEGFPLYLSCKAEEGQPQPTLTWYLDGQLVPNSRQLISPGIVRHDLTIASLTRRFYRSTFTCQSSNTNLAPPATTNVTIDMNLKPTSVKLAVPLRPLTALKETRLQCQSIGSRPPPTVTWWLGPIKMLASTQSTSFDGNVTDSVLVFRPESTDNGKRLICKAENRLVPESGLQDNWILNVYYDPVVTVELTRPTDKSGISEGSDVYLECHVAANPFVFKIEWRFQSKPLFNDPSTGIIISDQHVVIQFVRPNHVGSYVCAATNTEGEGQSRPFDLQIKHKPICPTQQSQYSFVSTNQTLELSCRLLAHPPNITFHWTSATAKGTKTLVSNSSLTNSFVFYTLNSESDLGTVSCWGTNEMGTQIKHCVFQIVMAEKPKALDKCVVYNVTETSLRVKCGDANDDGPLRNFTLELYDRASSKLLETLTNPTPIFLIENVKPSKEYSLALFATNVKGSGNSVRLIAQTHQETEGKDENDTGIPEWYVSTGILVCLMFVVIATVFFLKYNTKRKRKQLIESRVNERLLQLQSYLNDENLTTEEILPEETEKNSSGRICWRNAYKCCTKDPKCKQNRVFDLNDYHDVIQSFKWRKVEENVETILLCNTRSGENTNREPQHQNRRESWTEMNF